MERKNYLMLLNIAAMHPTPGFLKWLTEAVGEEPVLLWNAGDIGLAIVFSSEHSARELYHHIQTHQKTGLHSILITELGKDWYMTERGHRGAGWLTGHLGAIAP